MFLLSFSLSSSLEVNIYFFMYVLTIFYVTEFLLNPYEILLKVTKLVIGRQCGLPILIKAKKIKNLITYISGISREIYLFFRNLGDLFETWQQELA